MLEQDDRLLCSDGAMASLRLLSVVAIVGFAVGVPLTFAAVLRRAAGLKQQFPEEDENILMLRSIIDVNLPKFLQPDVPLFNGIASDLFPGVELPKADYDMMHECCLEYCAEANLQLTEKFFIKVTQRDETIVVT